MGLVKNGWREIVIATLILANVFVWIAVYEKRPGDTLLVYFLDVGQGDAILIESPSRGRVLIDGGKNRQTLSELGKILPFGDKRIDVVLATHPDSDHIGGLPEVIRRYDVGIYIEPGVNSDNEIDDELSRRLEEEGIRKVLARRGVVVNLGGGAKLTILFPNQSVSNWETNRASVVARLVYRDSEFLFTGDAPSAIENVLVGLDGARLESDVLKAGHHGSRTSTALSFVEAVSPEYAVISAGEDNSYGHPHEEVLENLASAGAKVLGTYDLGTIVFKTDGSTIEVR